MTFIESVDIDFIMNEMKDFKYPWFIAGGWAVDLGIGKITREHMDMDICIFRENIQQVLDYFSDWEIRVVIPELHELIPCIDVKDALFPRYCLHLRRGEQFLEILLTDKIDDEVIYRRNDTIRLSVSEFIRNDSINRPYVNPIWQLLFKSKNPREHDEMDFKNYLPYINSEEKNWLRMNINRTEPESKWLTELC
ncbi:hypothetical protein [Paenibacillus sp. SI8]|uniref:nucleotidyltransferase domain-containing protein n=1 Tax=unclassified Paenibacillus TaxID=185978 RepID=UPI0034663BE5